MSNKYVCVCVIIYNIINAKIFDILILSVHCSSQGSVPIPGQAVEMKCTWAACPALNKCIICNTEG